MSDTLTDRLREYWRAWGCPTDRDNCVNEECMALDCNNAALSIDALAAEHAEVNRHAESFRVAYLAEKARVAALEAALAEARDELNKPCKGCGL